MAYPDTTNYYQQVLSKEHRHDDDPIHAVHPADVKHERENSSSLQLSIKHEHDRKERQKKKKKLLFYPLRWLIYVFNPVVNTKLPVKQ